MYCTLSTATSKYQQKPHTYTSTISSPLYYDLRYHCIKSYRDLKASFPLLRLLHALFRSVFFSFFSDSRFYYYLFLFKILFLGFFRYKLFRRASQMLVAFPQASFSPLLLLIALLPIAILPQDALPQLLFSNFFC